MKRRGPNTDPRGTPVSILRGFDSVEFKLMMYFLSVRYDMNQSYAMSVILLEDIRVARISWLSVSKAEERSRRMVSDPNLEQIELCTCLVYV